MFSLSIKHLCSVCAGVLVFMFFWGDHGSTGWYDNPQPALRPVFIAAHAQPRVCEVSVCVGGVWRMS